MLPFLLVLSTSPTTQRTISELSKEAAKTAATGLLGFGMLCTAGLVLSGLLIYLMPTFVAAMRRHPNTAAIAVLNILAGWTFIGFVAALVWSFTAIPQKRRYAAGYED